MTLLNPLAASRGREVPVGAARLGHRLGRVAYSTSFATLAAIPRYPQQLPSRLLGQRGYIPPPLGG